MCEDIPGNDFAMGADLSLLKRNIDAGVIYRDASGEAQEPISFLREKGFNWMRLRLFHTPSGHGAQCNDLDYTIDLAKQLVAGGFKFLLDIHYSDTWADPGKQFIPRAWSALDFNELNDQVYKYTVETVSAFMAAGATPSMVQVGNEITSGMLWQHGQVADAHTTNSVHWHNGSAVNDPQKWKQFGELIKSGIRGVYDSSGQLTPIMIHIDRGCDIPTNQWFFDHLLNQGVEFDVIGQSYYPFWQGPPEELAKSLDFLGNRYGKDIHLAEVAYPHKHDEAYDNSLGGDHENWEKLLRRYPLSAEGQKRVMEDVIETLHASPFAKGLFYWAPEWTRPQEMEDEGDAPPCWARALFDEDGMALPALEVFQGTTPLAAR